MVSIGITQCVNGWLVSVTRPSTTDGGETTQMYVEQSPMLVLQRVEEAIVPEEAG